MNRSLVPLALVLPAFALVAPAPLAADLEGSLNARFKGSWVLILAPSASACDAYYNDNDVRGGRLEGKGGHRFAAGELARVERVDVKRSRIDVFLDLAEQVLAERRDGPFTLYDPLHCRIQMKVPTPPSPTLDQAEAALAPLLELHPDDRAAKESRRYNGRQRASYPPDYERTLAEYETWKAAQVNAAVQRRMDEAIAELVRIAQRSKTDPDYSQGFVEGLEKVRYRSPSTCDLAVTATFYPDSRGGKSGNWQRGYEDGQRAGFDIALLDRLRGCFAPPPR